MATDVYTATTATTGRLTAGGSVTSTLDTVGDLDWFAITLVANKSYSFTLEPGLTGGLEDPYLKLYSSDGQTVAESDDFDGLNSQIDVGITTPGTYYLEAGSGTNGAGTGAYVLSASTPIADDYADSSATAGTVTPGGSKTGEIEIVGDGDWFAINLVAGKRYTFSLDTGTLNGLPDTTNGLPDPLLSLYSSAGTLLTSNDDANELNSELTYTATTTGTFYLAASSGPNDSGTGTYVISSSSAIADDYPATVDTNGQVSAGGSATGQLEVAGDNDWYAISLVAGQQYTFSLDSGTTSGLEDPFLSIYNSAGTLVTSNDDNNGTNSEFVYTATATGTYYLGASASPNAAGTGKGSYTIAASNPSANGSTIVTGTTSNDTLTAGSGSELIDGGSGTDAVSYTGNRSTVSIRHNSDGTYTVTDSAGTDTLTNIEQVKFTDVTVNLTVQAKAASIAAASLNSLTELYIAFFNRVPDADGLSYWIDQFSGGQTTNQISESFYNVGASSQYSSKTGFSLDMSNDQFIHVFYKNVLGRADGADAGGLAYWNGKLADGSSTRWSLAQDILTSAHTFKGDTTWGHVADLLDNKVTVGKTFAVDDGLTYINDTYTLCQNIAAAVTSTGTTDAIQLIGVTDSPL
ncbi:MAG: DUF4214 domain-containing protein [Sterolibacterium sp.]